MFSKLSSVVLISCLLGCTSIHEKGSVEHDSAREDMLLRMQRGATVVVHKEPFGGVKRLSEAEQLKAKNAWLRDIRVTLDVKEPVSVTELVRMLKKQGINMTTATDLENHNYSGFGVHDVDGETALNVLLGAMGLDYSVNTEGRYVTITPLSSKTYYLNLGNRQVSFGGGTDSGGGTGIMGGSSQSSGGSGQGGSGGSSSSGGLGMSQSPGGMGQGGVGGGQSSGSGQSSSGGGGSQSNSIMASDNFWRSLSVEIEQRLKVLIPNRAAMMSGLALPPIMPNTSNSSSSPYDLGGLSMPPLPGGGGMPMSSSGPGGASMPTRGPGMTGMPNMNGSGGGASGAEHYIEQKMGNFSVNPETGAVTIRAPHWLLESFTDYFQRISDQYNTVVQFDCEIIQLTTNSESLQGLDVAAFGSFAHGQYGAAVTDNALGGVNVTLPSTTNTLATAAGSAFSGAVPMVGLVSAANKLQVFNAYLSNLGHVDIIQKPIIATSSGIPGEFKKMQRQFYNNIQQTSSSGGVGSAATATQNQQIPFDTGNWLRIFPHYDPTNGLVRAQISLHQSIQTGSQTQNQYLTIGNSIQQVSTQIPILSNQQYSGETLLRDGDLVIVGGQVEDVSTTNHSGITGLMDINNLEGVFGRKDTIKQHVTYYFALHVHVKNHKT